MPVTMRVSSPLRAWLLVFALCAAALPPLIAYVDRPVVDYVHANLRNTALRHWTVQALKPFLFVPVLALAILAAAGGWILSGRRLAAWARTPLVCSWGVAWAVSATTVMKHGFGRIAPDPYYTVRRIYEFRLLHADSAHLAFPSGTMAVSGAILTVLWCRHRRTRALTAPVLAALALALVITNSHWISDLIAGLFVGAIIGRMTVLLLSPNAVSQSYHPAS